MMAKTRNEQEMMNASLKEMKDASVKEMVDSNQVKVDDNLKEMKEEIRSGQAEIKSTVSATEEKVGGLHSRHEGLPRSDGCRSSGNDICSTA
jgi:hypothetical protein